MEKIKSIIKKPIVKILILIILILVFVFLIWSSIVVVDGGKTGVVKKMGAIKEEPLREGVHLVTPFVTDVIEINNKILRTDVEGEAASKDLQTIKSMVSVNYQISPDKSVFIYKTIGENVENIIIRPAIQECVKAVVANYTAEECITTRQTISNKMKEELNSKISNYGINIMEFNILNFNFSEEYNKAIEAKQTAQQNALKAQQDFERIKIENEQKISQAQAEATANQLKNQQLTDNILKDKFINKWNGEMPKVISSDSNILDVSNLVN